MNQNLIKEMLEVEKQRRAVEYARAMIAAQKATAQIKRAEDILNGVTTRLPLPTSTKQAAQEYWEIIATQEELGK